MEDKIIYDQLNKELEICLEKGIISKKLIDKLTEAKEQFVIFEEKSMKEQDVFYNLKLFSASNTCNDILRNSIEKLRDSKDVAENYNVFIKLYIILKITCELGNKLIHIFGNKVASREFDLKEIRNISLALQEEAEKIKLIISVDDKLRIKGD